MSLICVCSAHGSPGVSSQPARSRPVTDVSESEPAAPGGDLAGTIQQGRSSSRKAYSTATDGETERLLHPRARREGLSVAS